MHVILHQNLFLAIVWLFQHISLCLPLPDTLKTGIIGLVVDHDCCSMIDYLIKSIGILLYAYPSKPLWASILRLDHLCINKIMIRHIDFRKPERSLYQLLVHYPPGVTCMHACGDRGRGFGSILNATLLKKLDLQFSPTDPILPLISGLRNLITWSV